MSTPRKSRLPPRMATPTRRAMSGARQARSWSPRGLEDAEVRILLVAAMVVAAMLALWLGRDATFATDEIEVFARDSHLNLGQALHPYNGHLILTTRLLYAAI